MITQHHTPSLFDTSSETLTTILLKSVAGSLLIALGAQIAIPFWPVPMTMQPFAVLLLGLICSPLIAMTTVATYLIEGAMGLPVFSGFSGGIAPLMGTTGGFLLGFFALALVPSMLQEWSKDSFARQFMSSMLGQVALYTVGLLWLSTFVGFESAITLGLMPFLLKIPFTVLLAIVTAQVIETARGEIKA